MSRTTALSSLGRVCKRYGPGRLPRADNRVIGAGYAGASAAVAIATVFALGMFGLSQYGPTLETWAIASFWGVSALVAIPIVLTTAFAAGVVTWRALPSSIPYFGAVAGLLATVLTYLLSLAVVFAILLGVSLSDGTAPLVTAVTEVGVLTAFIGIFAAVLSGWVTLPLGCVSGAIYERARDAAPE